MMKLSTSVIVGATIIALAILYAPIFEGRAKVLNCINYMEQYRGWDWKENPDRRTHYWFMCMKETGGN